MLSLVVGAAAFSAPALHSRRPAVACIRATAPAAEGTAVEPEVRPPRDEAEMLAQATAAVVRGKESGLTRFTLRLFLPRDGELVPPDESWQGGIMQLYAVASPLVVS